MAANNTTPYTKKELAVLVEEFFTQQRKEFNLKGLYSYIVYWGMEEKRIEGDQLTESDKEKVNGILKSIVNDGRIKVAYGSSSVFVKQ